jgi:dolichol-phosphate mannosyltransferase
MKEAVSLTNAEILCFIDGDNTYDGSDLALIVRPIVKGKADMVVGSRMLDECKRESGSITHFNLLGNLIFNSMTNFALKSKITDILSGYRAVRRSVFESLFLSTSGFEIEAEMTIEALASGLRIVEVPLTNYRRRIDTETKLSPLGDGYKILKMLVLVLLSVRPLLFFGLASLFFFVAGLYPASLVLYEKIVTGRIVHVPAVVLASLLWTLSAILFGVGVLAQIMVITRRRIESLLVGKRAFERRT